MQLCLQVSRATSSLNASVNVLKASPGPANRLNPHQPGLSLTYAVCECGCADCDCLLTESR